MKGIDYKYLLHAYIESVGRCEGVTFINSASYVDSINHDRRCYGLTKEEIDELIRLDKEPFVARDAS